MRRSEIQLSFLITTFSNSPNITSVMDLRGSESLWKTLATIGIGNLFLFFIIVFVFGLGNRTLIWILIGIESACYFGALIVRRHIRQLLR